MAVRWTRNIHFSNKIKSIKQKGKLIFYYKKDTLNKLKDIAKEKNSHQKA